MAFHGPDGPGADLAQMVFEFGEGHFGRIEVGIVGGKKRNTAPRATLLEEGFGLCAPVAGQVVEDYHIALAQ